MYVKNTVCFHEIEKPISSPLICCELAANVSPPWLGKSSHYHLSNPLFLATYFKMAEEGETKVGRWTVSMFIRLDRQQRSHDCIVLAVCACSLVFTSFIFLAVVFLSQ